MPSFIRRRRPHSYAALALLCALLAPASALAARPRRAPAAPAPQEKKKDDKDASKEAQAKLSKQERRYQEIKKFSLNRYETNADFREEVEESYRRKQRDHSEYAYLINTRDAEDERRTRSGDKLKVEDTLYDNPLAQDYVNRVGQSLVPQGSSRLYAFKIVLNPIPEARSLSTGTVYVSTGLLSQVDNEAQLAYVLGHEVAHVERDHWREDVLVQHGLEDYNEKQQQKRKLIGGLTSIGLGAVTGGLANSFSTGANLAFFAEAFAMPNILKVAIPDAVVSWDKAQEDEADQLSLQYMLKRSYDPREAQHFYNNLAKASNRDRRTGLGFMANALRVTERVQAVSNLIGGFGGSLNEKMLVGSINLRTAQMMKQAAETVAAAQPRPEQPADTGKSLDVNRAGAAQAIDKALGAGPLAADLQAKLDAGELIGSTAEFEAVMAELKRDNGVRAFYYDMFQMARDNLEESLRIRSNDPYAHLYYGKVLKLTARTTSEKERALQQFVEAVKLDRRQVLPEARLHRALAMIERKETAQPAEIVRNLQEYVNLYQREHGGALPPNMDVIYDYMQEANEHTWAAIPATNVSTKNIDPVNVSTFAASRPTTQPAGVASPAQQSPAPAQTTAPAAPNSRGKGTRKP